MEPGVDPLRRAFAVLGLSQGAPLPEVRRRYRFLAQRWHPDRHAGDPRNQTEASAEMRRINEAYHTIVQHLAAAAPHAAPVAPGRRLTPEEIDALSRAIGSDGPVDWALGGIGWVGSAFEGVLGVIGAVLLAVRLLTDLPRGDFSVFREHPESYFIALLVAFVVIREIVARVRIADPGSRKWEP